VDDDAAESFRHTPADLSPLVDALSERIAVLVGDRLADLASSSATSTTPWLNAEDAALYLGDAPVSRIYDLVQQRKLTPHRDGRRLLFHRDDLDAYVEASS
jgi:excisionase family DNA binding protein